jgi:hypothetical protein
MRQSSGWVKGSYLGPVPGYSDGIGDIPQFPRANSVMARLSEILPRFLPYPSQFIDRPTLEATESALNEPKSTLFPMFQRTFRLSQRS